MSLDGRVSGAERGGRKNVPTGEALGAGQTEVLLLCVGMLGGHMTVEMLLTGVAGAAGLGGGNQRGRGKWWSRTLQT